MRASLALFGFYENIFEGVFNNEEKIFCWFVGFDLIYVVS